MKKHHAGKAAVDIFELSVDWNDPAADMAWELAAEPLSKSRLFTGIVRDEFTLYHPHPERLGNIPEFIGALAMVYAELAQTEEIVAEWSSTLDT